MDAKPTKFSSMLAEKKQFIVPLYQRQYSWKKKEWQQLWDDILRLHADPNPQAQHFLGPMVIVIQETSAVGIPEHLVIDGQQRLITISLLLAAIRNKAPENPRIVGDVTQYLTNQHLPEPSFFKLWPTQDDREVFSNIVKSASTVEAPSRSSRIFEAYRFFEGKVNQALSNELFQLDELLGIVDKRLYFVLIELTTRENAHLIFESLNAKGAPLTQADLIRNYFFMKVPKDEQNHVHEKYWKPIESQLKKVSKEAERRQVSSADGERKGADDKDYLTDFIRHFLMRERVDVDKSEVYLRLRESVEAMPSGSAEPNSQNKNQVIGYLENLGTFAGYYAGLLWPEEDRNIPASITQAVGRLNRLGITVSYYPFLLNVYDGLMKGDCSAESVLEIVAALENFVVRRTVCKIPPNSLNKIFGALIRKTNEKGLTTDVVKEFLAKNDYPSDIDFADEFPVYKLYGKTSARVILECIEASFGHKESVSVDDRITIEHVLPQNLAADWWRNALGEDFDRIHETYLHTIGNLTFTGYNVEESDKSFPEKKEYYKSSNFELTKELAKFDDWNESIIRGRAASITQRCIEKVWPHLNPKEMHNDSAQQRKKSPCALIINGERHEARGWSGVIHKTLEVLIAQSSERFDEVAVQHRSVIKKNKGKMPNPKQLSNGYFVTGQWPRERAEAFFETLTDKMELDEEDCRLEYGADVEAESQPALVSS